MRFTLSSRIVRRAAEVLVLGLVSLALLPAAFAHRANYALSELTWRVDQQNLEVVHSIHLDDAVLLLVALGNPHGNLTAATEAELIKYLQRTFSLKVAGEAVKLVTLGAQIDGDNLWLFQEATMPDFPVGMQVSSRFLFELFPDLSHQINLEIGGQVSTLLLDRRTDVAQF